MAPSNVIPFFQRDEPASAAMPTVAEGVAIMRIFIDLPPKGRSVLMDLAKRLKADADRGGWEATATPADQTSSADAS